MGIITYSMKKDWNKKLSKNFCAYEFACNDKSDEFKVATELVETLQQIRDHFGKPVLISSAYRTPAYNISIGGSSRSQHCLGTAADIHIAGIDPIRIVCDFPPLLSEAWRHWLLQSCTSDRRFRSRRCA